MYPFLDGILMNLWAFYEMSTYLQVVQAFYVYLNWYRQCQVDLRVKYLCTLKSDNRNYTAVTITETKYTTLYFTEEWKPRE